MQIKPFDLTEFAVAGVYAATDVLVTNLVAPYLALANPFAWIVEVVALSAPVLAIGLHRVVMAITGHGLNLSSSDTLNGTTDNSAAGQVKQGGNL